MKLLRKVVLAFALLAAGWVVVSPALVADVHGVVTPPENGWLSVQEIESLLQMIRFQPGESRWMEIDWYPSIWEARQKAAAEGKPIFIMAASGGAPPAGC